MVVKHWAPGGFGFTGGLGGVQTSMVYPVLGSSIFSHFHGDFHSGMTINIHKPYTIL